MSDPILLQALKLEPVPRIPVWFMRQAGRYLPEYRKVRSEVGSFLELCKNPELAASVTLQPLARFPLDAAIIFADILLIPHAMGLDLSFVVGEGPVFADSVTSEAAVSKLQPVVAAENLKYVLDAIRIVKHELTTSCPLIGFAGSPWTVACYMIEGSGSSTFLAPRTMLYQNPSLLHELLQKITIATIDYVAAQVDAGADIIMLFDSWGGLLAPSAFQEFSLRYINNIVAALKQKYPHIPSIVFVKDGGRSAMLLADTGCNAIGVDWTADLTQVRQQVGDRLALQGNLDPALLFAPRERLLAASQNILQANAKQPGYIFNLGHGIPQHVDPEQIAALVELAHNINT